MLLAGAFLIVRVSSVRQPLFSDFDRTVGTNWSRNPQLHSRIGAAVAVMLIAAGVMIVMTALSYRVSLRLRRSITGLALAVGVGALFVAAGGVLDFR